MPRAESLTTARATSFGAAASAICTPARRVTKLVPLSAISIPRRAQAGPMRGSSARVGTPHTFSTADTPAAFDLVELPAHTVVRTLEDNAALRARVAQVKPRKTQFFRVKTVDGVVMDGWMITPKDFDPA